MLIEEKGIIPRILRDMNEGVLVLDRKGVILYLNEKGRTLLGKTENPEGKKYSVAFLAEETDGTNDGFHQFVLDAVYDKENAHSGEVVYKSTNQETHHLNLTSSFLCSEDLKEKIGIVVVFSDITELVHSNRQRREASTVFAVLMICVCVYLFMWSLLRHLNIEPPGWVMNLLIEGISILMFIVILKTTSFSIHDIGLRITDVKKTFVPDIWITVIGAAALVLGKVVLLRSVPGFFPEGAPFWDWSVGTVADIFYPATVVLQEFLARGVMQENLNRVFTGKYATILSIVVSSLVFGVLHIHYGFMFMVASTVLLGALGMLYHRQGNIWGLCIIHYVLGEAATFLRYIV